MGELEMRDEVRAAPDPRRWWALALLCGAFFMVILDGTIVLVALPSVGADLHFSKQGLQWGSAPTHSRSAAYSCSEDGQPTCSDGGGCS